MRLKPIVTALCAGALLAAAPFASAKELKAIGVTVGDLANPFFVPVSYTHLDVYKRQGP